MEKKPLEVVDNTKKTHIFDVDDNDDHNRDNDDGDHIYNDDNGIIMTVTNGNDVDSTDHGEEATGHPDDETHVDAARALKNSCWGDEDSAPDDATHDHLGHRDYHDDDDEEDDNGWQR